VLADERHLEVGDVPAAVFLGEGGAVEAGLVRPTPGLVEQVDPLVGEAPAALPVGPGVLAAVVEERGVVGL